MDSVNYCLHVAKVHGRRKVQASRLGTDADCRSVTSQRPDYDSCTAEPKPPACGLPISLLPHSKMQLVATEQHRAAALWPLQPQNSLSSQGWGQELPSNPRTGMERVHRLYSPKHVTIWEFFCMLESSDMRRWVVVACRRCVAG